MGVVKLGGINGASFDADILCDNLNAFDCLYNDDGTLKEDAAEKLEECWAEIQSPGIGWKMRFLAALALGDEEAQAELADELFENFMDCLCE